MAEQIYEATDRIKHACGLINDVEDDRFMKMLNRILNKLHSKTDLAFSEVEQEKLAESLQMSLQNLLLVLSTITFIFEQAAYYILKPGAFQNQLEMANLQLTPEKVECFVSCWKNKYKSVLENLKGQSIAPRQFENLDWEISVEMSQSRLQKQKNPAVYLDFSLQNELLKDTEHVQLEFDHQSLFTFFQKIEQIQSQLDSLK